MRWKLLTFFVLATIGFVAFAARPKVVLAPQVQVLSATTEVHRPELGNCVSQGALPDKDCTPGAVFTSVTKSQVCVRGYAGSVRDVSEKLKKQVFAAYGIKEHRQGEYEVDHLVSLELGGDNSLANLWPEPALPKPGFHEKDIVENFLHAQVCDSLISLEEAQKVIATDWLDIFHQMRD